MHDTPEADDLDTKRGTGWRHQPHRFVFHIKGRGKGQARAGQSRAGQGRAGQGRAGQGRAGQGKAEQGRAGQGRAGQGRAGQGRAEQGPTNKAETLPTCISFTDLLSKICIILGQLLHELLC